LQFEAWAAVKETGFAARMDFGRPLPDLVRLDRYEARALARLNAGD
jgi:hypothetical protein